MRLAWPSDMPPNTGPGRSKSQSASLADLVGLQLGPYLDRSESQVSVEGPTVLLKPDAAQNLGFALHELATNAAKYGALSVPEGRVSIAWRLLPETDGNGVELDWVESCGPAVVKPTHRGFGSMVIERNLARELDTQVELAFGAEGVQCKILLPPGQIRASSGLITRLAARFPDLVERQCHHQQPNNDKICHSC